ncbi:MAG: beta-glucosidase [Ruminococcaceae bacterium]|nr:beta-glucosidase [Oscillospiraceae bacterium]
MNNWTRMFYQPCMPVGVDGRRITGSKEHIELSRRVAADGMVLLKNDGLLPFKKGTKLAIFGKAQYDFVKGGGGSGDVHCAYTRNIYQGFKIKEEEGKVQVYDGLYQFYKDNLDAQYAEEKPIGWTEEPTITEEQIKKAREFADTAIVTVCRYSREHFDRAGEKGDFYLSENEQAMVDGVCKHFSKVAVVLNVGGMVDSEWFKDNDTTGAALLAWNPGMEGGLAIADIMVGDVTPSGKLVDTFAKTFDDYPSSANFNESDDYVKYTEDIYVGYRYFETIPGAKDKVNYPFGFGLSYTTFALSDVKVFRDGEKIKATVKVTNTGDVSGREVVQLYTEEPQGKLGRPARELRAFGKTKLLAPSESEVLDMEFDISDMAAFDDTGRCKKSAFVLEKGDYYVHIGTSVRDTVKADFVYTVEEEFKVIKESSSYVAPKELEKRLRADGTYEDAPRSDYKPFKYKKLPVNEAEAPEEPVKFCDVADGKVSMDSFLKQLTTDELINLLYGKANVGVCNTSGFGPNITDLRLSNEYRGLGIPCAWTADGPAGLRINKNVELPTTAFPCATLIACTWDPSNIEEIGKAGALEVLENNLSIWLTPALNIHRTPLCGRNFEYFAEDPLLSGKFAAAKIRGIQSKKIAACAKHFACNNKETNRKESDSIVSERALREIYLKGFEICIKESDPYVLMTSYNKVNGCFTSENYELLTELLRGEWGFKGVITTDWTCHGLHYLETKAGNDIKMPVGHPESYAEMIKSLRITREEIEACARRVLELLIKLR